MSLSIILWIHMLVMAYGCMGSRTCTHTAEVLPCWPIIHNRVPLSDPIYLLLPISNLERTKYDREPLSPRQPEKLES